jgi:hypothetical protein
MRLLAGPYTTYVNEKENLGMTFAIFETSHVALHIWDDTNPGLMQLDVYFLLILVLKIFLIK